MSTDDVAAVAVLFAVYAITDTVLSRLVQRTSYADVIATYPVRCG